MCLEFDYKYIQFKRNIRSVNQLETIASALERCDIKISTFDSIIINQ